MLAGVCQPRVVGTVGAEPFSAKLRYTGTEDSDHPNLIKLTVTMPHIDGRSCWCLGTFGSSSHISYQLQLFKKKKIVTVKPRLSS